MVDDEKVPEVVAVQVVTLLVAGLLFRWFLKGVINFESFIALVEVFFYKIPICRIDSFKLFTAKSFVFALNYPLLYIAPVLNCYRLRKLL